VTVTITAGAASDAAGNATTVDSNTASVTFDSIAPTVTADSQTASTSTPTLTGTVDDSTATVQVTADGQVLTAQVTGTTWSAAVQDPLANGTYDIAVTATDMAGNVGSATVTGGLVVNA
jgi:hypothetical protein